MRFTRVILSLLAVLTLATSAFAYPSQARAEGVETEPASVPTWSLKRVGFGIGLGAMIYNQGVAEKVGHNYGFCPEVVASYSAGPVVSFGGSYKRDLTTNEQLGKLELGPRILVNGTGQGDGLQVALGANWVKYDGDAAEFVGKKETWNAGLYFSLSFGKHDAKQPINWYGKFSGVKEPETDNATEYVAVEAVYKSPSK